MDQIYQYSQKKIEKRQERSSECDIALFYDGKTITLVLKFNLFFTRFNQPRQSLFEESLIIDTETGDIIGSRNSTQINLKTPHKNESKLKSKKNDFLFISDLSMRINRGERNMDFWGKKYKRAISCVADKILEIITPLIDSEYNLKKIRSDEFSNNKLYYISTVFHVDKVGIKGHNNIYLDIQFDYPKKKWLKRNDYKFVPAVLESYGIKSKYLIKHVSMADNHPIRLFTLNYLCKLFGDDYLRYIKEVAWESECIFYIYSKKIHMLKNDQEKRALVRIFNEWKDSEEGKYLPLISTLQTLFITRSFIESKGIPLIFNPKNVEEFNELIEKWNSIKVHYRRGYKLKFDFPQNFIDKIETPIIINENIFMPKVLTTEEEFAIEGAIMKNCMGIQFKYGLSSIYISIEHGKKRVNAQYTKGELRQHFGKANTPILDYFYPPLDIIRQRFSEFSDMSWAILKYDFS